MSDVVNPVIPCPRAPVERVPLVPQGFETFTFGRFRFDLAAKEPLDLPKYKGSVFRGRFGAALRYLSCSPDRDRTCDSCILAGDCVYARLFETPVRPDDEGLVQGMRDAPHPMVFRPPRSSRRHYDTGDHLEIEIILIGDAIRFVPQMICAVEDSGRRGVGKQRGKFVLNRMSAMIDGRWETVYSGDCRRVAELPWIMTGSRQADSVNNSDSERIRIRFETPLRIKTHGKMTDSLSFEMLMKNLLRRIKILDEIHCEGAIVTDYARLLTLAAQVETIEEDLWWTEWGRYSQRRNMTIKMGGLIGSMVVQGDLAEFLPWLKLGEVLHVGKGTIYGMGRYSLKSLN